MTNFIELTPFKYGEAKEPIIINTNCINAVLVDGGTFSKILVNDDMKECLDEQITAGKFMYIIKPTYEELAKILTQKGEVLNNKLKNELAE
jgi:hypothetical protein